MSSQEPCASALSLADVAAMSDAALAKFIEQHRCPDGNVMLPIDGWEALSKHYRTLLPARLKSSPARGTHYCTFTDRFPALNSEPFLKVP